MTPKRNPLAACAAVLAMSLALNGCGSDGSDAGPTQPAPVDTTPPGVPAALAIVSARNDIQLEWDDNAEADLAGYNVQRSQDLGETWQNVAAGLTVSNFTDVYRHRAAYRVSSFDLSSNESAFSDRVDHIGVSGPPKVPSNPIDPQ